MTRLKELLFTGFYAGYCPFASGTAGTLIAFLIYAIEFEIFGSAGRIINIIVVLLMIYPSVRLGDSAENFFLKKDPSEVVLDEMMGYWISVLFFPFNWRIAIAAFIIFRTIDIIKPLPIKRLENIKGGLGIMVDDFLSGIYTNIIIRIILYITGLYNIKIL